FDATGLTGFHSMALINIVILFVAAILMAIIACRIFQKRDLPL
ncbi:ABC transporter permease, partial [Coprobacillus cateniformis]|nr:ABC transporter permease [Coprobacillus cateniformis]